MLTHTASYSQAWMNLQNKVVVQDAMDIIIMIIFSAHYMKPRQILNQK